MLIGSELPGHGVQIFDMKKLLTIDPAHPVTFDGVTDLTGHFSEGLPQGSLHNVVVNEELGYGVAVGARPRTFGCLAGLQFFDLKDPSNPIALGCNPDDQYVHDVSITVKKTDENQN